MLLIAKGLALVIFGTFLTSAVMMWTLEFFMRLQKVKGVRGGDPLDASGESLGSQVDAALPEKEITISFDFDGKRVELKGITQLRVTTVGYADHSESILKPEVASVA